MDFLVTLAIEIAKDVVALLAFSVTFFFIAEKM
jgi:hypothetical protein